MHFAQNHQQFLPEHLLKVLVDDEEGLAGSLIDRAGGDSIARSNSQSESRHALAALPKVSGGNGQLYLSQPLAKVMATAEEIAKKAGDSVLSPSSGCLPL